jgi:DNA invertase Pin-like site-specific DNA recombinase
MYGSPAIDDRPTLVYCRESRDENSREFQRIETQRDILLAFCQRRGLVNIVDVILDDDCTGTSFQRFDEVLERVRRKEIQVIVFKDSSRLGRNLKESLIFVEQMETLGAEILFESEEYNEDFFPLKAWFNEQRAKEDSQKIRRVLRHKMETGSLLVKPFYGYRRSADGGMVPEPETAAIVQWIFQETAKGRGSGDLAAELNARGVPTPSQAAGYRNAMDCWVSQHIRRVVTNPVYIGTMTHHRTSKKSYKNKKTVCHPESEWIVLENHHPPLVSKELFEEVQRTRRKFKRTKYTAQNRPFSGLLRCGRCGNPLVLRSRKGRPDAYICGKNHREGAVKDDVRPNYGCRPHSVREDVLYDAALGHIKRLLETSDVDLPALARQRDNSPDHTETLEMRLAALRRNIDQVYADKLAGVIQEDFFARKYQEFTRREEELLRQLREARQTENKAGKNQLTALKMGDIIQALSNKFVTKTVLRLAFDQILVYEPNELLPEDAWRLGLTEETAKQLQTRGGILFLENAAP